MVIKISICSVLLIDLYVFRRNDIGPAAFNDSILLESCVYSVLREWFHQEPSYPALLDTMLQLSR